MNDEDFKKLIRDAMEYEADRIMAEVNADPDVKDVVAPEGMYEEFVEKYGKL